MKVDFENYGVPLHLQPGLRGFIEQHIEPGGFLTAVLTNDLKEACSRADEVSKHSLWSIVHFLWNEAPSASWGSVEKVESWLQMREL